MVAGMGGSKEQGSQQGSSMTLIGAAGAATIRFVIGELTTDPGHAIVERDAETRTRTSRRHTVVKQKDLRRAAKLVVEGLFHGQRMCSAQVAGAAPPFAPMIHTAVYR